MLTPCLVLAAVAAAPQEPPAADRAPDRTAVVRSDVEPVRAVRVGQGHWFVDFGQAGFGNLRLTIPDPEPGRRIVVHLGEAQRGDATVEREPGGTVRYQRAELVLEAGRTEYRPALTWASPRWLRDGYVAMPEEVGEVAPFRYAELEGIPEPFDPEQIVQEVWHVPFDDGASAFESSSRVLDDVWALCKHTMKVTSFAGVYVDGDRERRPYEADALINQLSHYAVDAHYETARHSWIWLLEHPTWPTEWILQAPVLAWNDVLWSGDTAAVEAHYDALRARTLIDRRRDDGLLLGRNRGEPRDIVDWPAGERDGYDMAPAVKTVVSAWHVESLRCMARIAAVLGRDADAAELARLAATTVAAIDAELWDEARGCYVDGLDPETKERSAHTSLHASLFPLAFGIVPEDRVARVVAFVESRGMACSVYGAQFLVDGLYRAGAADAALRLLTATDERSWAHMLYDVGSTVTLEAWDPKFKPNLDWNHAWGAAPANLIVRGLMGIEPLEPGFARFRVRPQLGSLARASVRAPTPRGAVDLRVTQEADGAWRAELRVPVGTKAELYVPTADPQAVRVDTSTEVRPLGVRGDETVFEVSPGRVLARVTVR